MERNSTTSLSEKGGSGVEPPAKLNDTDPAVRRDARAEYIRRMTDAVPIARLDARERATVREECQAVLRDMGFHI
jgi:hypothetical protein